MIIITTIPELKTHIATTVERLAARTIGLATALEEIDTATAALARFQGASPATQAATRKLFYTEQDSAEGDAPLLGGATE